MEKRKKRQYPAALLPPSCFPPHAAPLFFTESPSSLPPSLVCLFPAAPSTHNPLTRRVISHFILVSPPHVSFLARGEGTPLPATHLLYSPCLPSYHPHPPYYTLPPDIPPLDDVIRISAFPLTNSFLSPRFIRRRVQFPPRGSIFSVLKGKKALPNSPVVFAFLLLYPLSLSLSLSLSILLAIGLKWA